MFNPYLVLGFGATLLVILWAVILWDERLPARRRPSAARR
jgi:hypothetical protein